MLPVASQRATCNSGPYHVNFSVDLLSNQVASSLTYFSALGLYSLHLARVYILV